MKKSQKLIPQHLSDFLDWLDIEKGLSSKSQENYNTFLKSFLNFLNINNLEKLKPHQLTKEHIWQYKVYLSRQRRPKTKKGLKKTTQNYYLIALRSLLTFFADRDILSLPPEKIKLPKRKKERKINFLPLEQIEKLLNTPNSSTPIGLRDRVILETLFSTGVRVAELISLNQDQLKINKETKDLEISIIGKGDSPRTIYFSERVIYWLKKYLETRDDEEKALFISYKGRKPLTRLTVRTVERIIKKYAILAGVPLFTTPHTLRHCLHPYTRIILSDKILSARDLFFCKASQAQTINWKNLVLNNKKIINKNYHIASLLSIWAGGYNLVCSPDHRLFTIGKYGIQEIKAKDVKTGTYVMGVKRIKIKEKSCVGAKFARLLGYILGDGTISKRRRGILLDDKNKNILKFYQNLVRELFILNPPLEKNNGKNSWQLRIYNTELVEFLLNFGFKTQSNTKRIPKEILSSSLEELAEFIAGLYDAEGNSGTIRLFSSSLNLLKDVQIAFLRFGIDSHINYRQRTVVLPSGKKFSHKFYTLHILHRPDQLKFVKKIKTLKKRSLYIEPIFQGEKLPVGQLLKIIQKDVDQKKIKWIGKLRQNHSIHDLGRYFYKLVPARKTVKKIIAQLEDVGYRSPLLETLKKITATADLKWLKVKERNRLPWGRYSTYDFGLNQKVGNLITDGFVSHNSFATDLLNKGVDLRTVQEFLGHRNIATTQIYTHVTHKRLRDIHRKFHGIKDKSSQCRY